MDRSGRPVRPDRSAPPNNDPDPPRAEVLQRAESSHSRRSRVARWAAVAAARGSLPADAPGAELSAGVRGADAGDACPAAPVPRESSPGHMREGMTTRCACRRAPCSTCPQPVSIVRTYEHGRPGRRASDPHRSQRLLRRAGRRRVHHGARVLAGPAALTAETNGRRTDIHQRNRRWLQDRHKARHPGRRRRPRSPQSAVRARRRSDRRVVAAC